jgi:FMN phosphatase YigB (HAD superfamily)
VERILLELEAGGTNGDSGRRRSALEQLARELGPVDPELSSESRVLAWAPTDPPPDAIEELARRARQLVGVKG